MPRTASDFYMAQLGREIKALEEQMWQKLYAVAGPYGVRQEYLNEREQLIDIIDCGYLAKTIKEKRAQQNAVLACEREALVEQNKE